MKKYMVHGSKGDFEVEAINRIDLVEKVDMGLIDCGIAYSYDDLSLPRPTAARGQGFGRARRELKRIIEKKS